MLLNRAVLYSYVLPLEEPRIEVRNLIREKAGTFSVEKGLGNEVANFKT